MKNGYSEAISILAFAVISVFLVQCCLEDDDHHGSRRPPDNVLIPSGCFYMGDWFSEGDADEGPLHNVCISSFRIDRYEVTNAKYKTCEDAGACTAPSASYSNFRDPYYGDPAYANYPMVWVEWDQAAAYCAWAGKRLPTEAEWEYAARGGLEGKRYVYGDTISCADACYARLFSSDLCWNYDGIENDTQPVGTYAPNGYGLYDMAGNVEEWVSDFYDSNYYNVSPPMDPTGPASGTYHVRRGGGLRSDAFASSVRVADRDSSESAICALYIGFRCASD